MSQSHLSQSLELVIFLKFFCGKPIISGLTSVTIGSSVTSIGDKVFNMCSFKKQNFVNYSSLNAEANHYWGATVTAMRVNQSAHGALLRKRKPSSITDNR